MYFGSKREQHAWLQSFPVQTLHICPKPHDIWKSRGKKYFLITWEWQKNTRPGFAQKARSKKWLMFLRFQWVLYVSELGLSGLALPVILSSVKRQRWLGVWKLIALQTQVADTTLNDDAVNQRAIWLHPVSQDYSIPVSKLSSLVNRSVAFFKWSCRKNIILVASLIWPHQYPSWN